MKKVITTFCIVFIFSGVSFSQNYLLNPINLNVQGSPGDFLLSTLIVNNTSGSPITMHLKRIVKNLPPNWTSCFCFPTCIAPFIDTLTFSITPFSSDSIKPNYNTDPSTPGIGYITITLYQEGFPNNIDTIAFSGSTLASSGINENNNSTISIYPNPVSDFLMISSFLNEPFSVKIFNETGEVISENFYSKTNTSISLKELNAGIYFINVRYNNGKTTSKKFLKIN